MIHRVYSLNLPFPNFIGSVFTEVLIPIRTDVVRFFVTQSRFFSLYILFWVYF